MSYINDTGEKCLLIILYSSNQLFDILEKNQTTIQFIFCDEIVNIS